MNDPDYSLLDYLDDMSTIGSTMQHDQHDPQHANIEQFDASMDMADAGEQETGQDHSTMFPIYMEMCSV
jgi:hypothetical protein